MTVLFSSILFGDDRILGGFLNISALRITINELGGGGTNTFHWTTVFVLGEIERTANMAFAKWRVMPFQKLFADSTIFVLNCGSAFNKPPLRKPPNRCHDANIG